MVREDVNGTKASATYTPTVLPITKFVDKEGKEIVTWFKIDFIRNEIDAMFQDRRIKLNKQGLLNPQTEIQW